MTHQNETCGQNTNIRQHFVISCKFVQGVYCWYSRRGRNMLKNGASNGKSASIQPIGWYFVSLKRILIIWWSCFDDLSICIPDVKKQTCWRKKQPDTDILSTCNTIYYNEILGDILDSLECSQNVCDFIICDQNSLERIQAKRTKCGREPSHLFTHRKRLLRIKRRFYEILRLSARVETDWWLGSTWDFGRCICMLILNVPVQIQGMYSLG